MSKLKKLFEGIEKYILPHPSPPVATYCSRPHLASGGREDQTSWGNLGGGVGPIFRYILKIVNMEEIKGCEL